MAGPVQARSSLVGFAVSPLLFYARQSCGRASGDPRLNLAWETEGHLVSRITFASGRWTNAEVRIQTVAAIDVRIRRDAPSSRNVGSYPANRQFRRYMEAAYLDGELDRLRSCDYGLGVY